MELYCIKCPLTVQSECDIKPVINNITDDKNVCVSVNVTLTMILTHVCESVNVTLTMILTHVCESVNVTLTMILTNSVKHTVMF
jgi:hypothetical protein